jgi:hypothetical protein
MLREKSWRVLVVIAVLAIVAPPTSMAQDSHYWTDQLGNRAQLLGGAVIGSDENMSAVYYNPGRIGRGVNPELIITGNIFELEQLSVKEDEPPGREVDQLRFRGLPSLFAGEVYGRWLGKNRLAYSFFTRTDAGFRSTERFGETFAPGEFNFDFFEDELQIDSSLNESWAGLTWGRPVGPRQGVGVSTFVAVRNDRSRVTAIRQAIFESGDLGIRFDNQDLDYYNWRLLWKAGYSTTFEGWRLGATLTTPSISLFGSGSVNLDDSLVVTGDSENFDNRIISNSQSDLSATYKSPVSIGLGASRDFKSWSFHFSMEWFDSVSPYTVVDAEPFVNQDTGEIFEPDIVHALDSVTNFALGYEKRFKNGNRAYGSFRSDFSAAPDRGESNLAITDWDLWHLGGGLSFGIGKTDMTIGAIYAFGNSEPSPILNDPDDQVTLGFNRLTFIIGFDLPTKPRAQDVAGSDD